MLTGLITAIILNLPTSHVHASTTLRTVVTRHEITLVASQHGHYFTAVFQKGVMNPAKFSKRSPHCALVFHYEWARMENLYHLNSDARFLIAAKDADEFENLFTLPFKAIDGEDLIRSGIDCVNLNTVDEATKLQELKAVFGDYLEFH